MFKICTIGCGNHSSLFHGPAYKKYREENSCVELTACCDIDRERAEVYKNRFGFKKCFTDYTGMLSCENPDAVCIVLPYRITAGIAEKVMSLGYPVHMEKPPGSTPDETLKLIQAAESNGVPNQVGFNRRFTPLVQELQKILTGELGDQQIHNIRYDFYRCGRKDEDFYATAIHGIDNVRYLAGSEYKYVNFTYQEFPEIGKRAANIFMDCIFESGTTAQLNFCPVAGVVYERAAVNLYNNTFSLALPLDPAIDGKGRLIHMKDKEVILYLDGADLPGINDKFETQGFYRENKLFFDTLREGKKPENNIKSSLQSMEVAYCIEKRLSEYSF